MKTSIIFFIGLLALTSLAAVSDEHTPDKNETEPARDEAKINYAIGYRIGSNLRAQGISVDPASLIEAITDGLNDNEPRFSKQEMRTLLRVEQNRITAEKRAKQAIESKENLALAESFLADNSKKEGVTTLASGLQYRVIQAGTGASPTKTQKVNVHYRGTLMDGSEFDSSHKRNKPANFAVNRVIPGWTEALQLMQEGAKWNLYIPPKLGYGPRGSRSIPANSLLIFEVELLSVEVEKPSPETAKPAETGK